MEQAVQKSRAAMTAYDVDFEFYFHYVYGHNDSTFNYTTEIYDLNVFSVIKILLQRSIDVMCCDGLDNTHVSHILYVVVVYCRDN